MHSHLRSVVLVLGLLTSIMIAVLFWRHADFFLAKREFYTKSKFELLKQKISISISVFIAVFLLFIAILEKLMKE